MKAFGQTAIYVDCVDVFNVDDVCAVLQVVPHIDQANAGYAVKRSHDLQARSSVFGQRKFGLRDLQIGRTFIK